MKILLTGATGFIGTNVATKLISNGDTIFCTLLENEINPFDSLNVKAFSLGNYQIVDLIQFIKDNQIEGVIHLASYVQSGDHTTQDIDKLIDSNVKFGTILLDAAVNGGVKWFINTGTFWQNYNNSEYSPVNLYAATKQAFESIAKLYIDTEKIRFCTIKLFDTYGPNDSRPKIFNLWEKIAKTGEILDMSPGDQILDISYIDDIANAFVLLANHLQNNNPKISNGKVYVVRARNRYNLKELACIFEEVTGYKLYINWGGRPYKVMEVMNPLVNGEVVPGWKQKITLEEGIKLTLNF
jgi:nucleoside-diphosphate-sugar epimerase